MKRTAAFVAASILVITLVPACGGDSGAGDAGGTEQEGAGLFDLPLITNTDTTYTVDDLVSVGYKKSKQIDTETLPNAQDAWSGFFNQLDIEVWVYESHQDALDFGVDPAEVISEVTGAPKGGIFGIATHRVQNKYATYVVFGNLVMLCQTELATCEALIAELD